MAIEADRAMLDRLLGNLSTGRRELGPEIARVPVADYVEPERAAQETAVLFRRLPLLLGPASQLAGTGDFLTRDVAGLPLLVTRDAAGRVRAFVNACRHRGALV